MFLHSFYVLMFNCICSYIVLTVSIGSGAYFVYYKYIKCDKENVSIYDYAYQAKNY